MYNIKSYKEFRLLTENYNVIFKNKTSFMTLDEYKNNVSPIFKEYVKFIKKNNNYFKDRPGKGIEQYTYKEYEIDSIERLNKMGINNISNKEYFIEEWIKSGREYIKEIPNEIYVDYTNYINKLKDLFGEQMNLVWFDEINSNKESIKRSIKNDTYINSLLDGYITPEKLEDIVSSVGLKLPKRVIDMKNKVESEGYNRSISDKNTEENYEFSEKIKSILYNKSVIKELKERKRKSIINLVEAFEKSGINNIYKFSIKINKSETNANDILNGLFDSSDNHYIDSTKYRKNNFYEIIEKITDNYVDSVISKFIHRSNKKLSVINDRIGLPNITIGEFHVQNDIEGELQLIWDNGFKLILKARIILAGGTNLQRLHERYLLYFFKDGKKIDIEHIDKLF